MAHDPLSDESLAERLVDPVVLVGIGRTDAGDDAVGPLVAEQLADCPHLTSLNARSVPENFLGQILAAGPRDPADRPDGGVPAGGGPTVVLVDAADFGAEAGAVRWLTPEQVAVSHFGTHAAPSALLSYLQASGCTVYLLGVQAGQMGAGRVPSVACAAAVKAIVSAFRQHFQSR